MTTSNSKMTAGNLPQVDNHAVEDKSPVLKIIFWTLAFQIAWHFGKIRNLFAEGYFQDPDDFLRLHQIRNWLSGQNGWYDVSVPRMNPPTGGDMHWSRLVDVPIALFTGFFDLFTTTHTAEKLAAIVWPTFLLTITVLVLIQVTRKLFGQVNPLLVVLFTVTCITAQVEFAPARIDHHGAQILLYCLILLGLVNAQKAWGHVLIAIASVLSIVIGLDLALMLAMVFAWLGLEWVTGMDEDGRGLKTTGLALGLSALVFYPMVVAPANWLVPRCDAISIVYLAAFVLIGTGFVFLGSASRLLTVSSSQGTVAARALAGIATGLLVLGLLYGAFPQCSAGPLSNITPDLKNLWLGGVVEAMGLVAFAGEFGLQWYALAAYVLLSIVLGLYFIRTGTTHPRFIAIWASLIITFALGFLQVRMFRIGLFATVPVCAMAAHLAMGWFAQRYTANKSLRLAAGVATIIMLLSPVWMILGTLTTAAVFGKNESVQVGVLKDPESGSLPGWTKNPDRIQCGFKSDFELLNSLPKGLVFNGINIGPAILVFTGHDIIGGNYHRNGEAILDIYHFFKGNPGDARKLLEKHPADYVALCKPHPLQGNAKYGADSLGGRILGGNLPDWLKPVSSGQDHLAVVRVDRDMLKRTGGSN